MLRSLVGSEMCIRDRPRPTTKPQTEVPEVAVSSTESKKELQKTEKQNRFAGRAAAAIAARSSAAGQGGTTAEETQRAGALVPSAPSTVPGLMAVCVSYLYQYGMATPMIFQIKAVPRDVAKVRDTVESGEDLAGVDPHVVANLLLRHLREMPVPILGFEMYDQWVAALGEGETRAALLGTLSKLIDKLPTKNRSLLDYFLCFLYQLSAGSGSNHMSAQHAARTFGIFFLRPQGFNPNGGAKAARLVETLLANYTHLFK
eukprot:TRINITY_DN22842_c0_g1_i3.p1 TRINITY_DN22842_c0_g1~~TRINITY_DN22842_c0_g1_i3.p1  ORF type:complete len:259 (-),score=62.22 TRINITY_DN22842_c0_g1_i3:262-1038(-)